jgi:hypothetical protein|tara:strand:+ start:3770 stop:3916 length:147 start_codon:yes stop_codon:yes gene_type:complete
MPMSLLKRLYEYKLIIFSTFLMAVVFLFMPEVEKPRCVDMVIARTRIC